MTTSSSSGGPAIGLPTLLRLEQVLAILPVSRSTFYAGIDTGRFPRPEKNGNIALWRLDDIAKVLAEPSNGGLFVGSRRVPRNLSKSAAYGGARFEVIEASAQMLEVIAIGMLLAAFEKFRQESDPTAYDLRCAKQCLERLNGLFSGEVRSSIRLGAYWKP